MVLSLSVTGASATRAELDAWVNAAGLPVTSVIDATPGGTERALGMRETAYVIDLATMTVVGVYQGSLVGTGSARPAIDQMFVLLGRRDG